MAMSLVGPYSCTNLSHLTQVLKQRRQRERCPRPVSVKSHLVFSSFSSSSGSFEFHYMPFHLALFHADHHGRHCSSRHVVACISSSSSSHSTSSTSTKLYISGLSFRTTEESLRNAFVQFGQLVEVNLVMDRIANRPRGFAFISYATEEESRKAIEGMHGKFLDGRVIFVEVAKPRSEIRKKSPISRDSQL
ncbi:small RNA-binding protein 11, chloroplastic-like [Silene latifolia]|uniref:small RNA-binding protein 11, chloroplastic-like n=1 Tax=Silene latifolia TaxID=37657 RepID=UPI003D76BC6E